MSREIDHIARSIQLADQTECDGPRTRQYARAAIQDARAMEAETELKPLTDWESDLLDVEAKRESRHVATVSVRLNIDGLADDLQAAADAIRARLNEGVKS